MSRKWLCALFALILGMGLSEAQAGLLRSGASVTPHRATRNRAVGTGHIYHGMPYTYGHPAYGDMAAMHHR